MNSSLLRLLPIALTSLAAAAAPACAAEGEIVGGLARADGRALEAIDGFSSHYGSVETSDGARLRTIITIPDGAAGPVKPLLFTQWVSCGSVEFRSANNNLAYLAQHSGLAVLRVERASDGDSIGASCDTLDYDTEVSHYIEAYRALLKDPRIDTSGVFVYGSSLGSTTAPLVAKALQDDGYDIAGVAVQGGGAETYYERMLTFDRHYLERRPEIVRPETIHDELIARAKFHYEYLINDRAPDDIASDNETMARVRADIRGLGEENHYGRPFAWHQQAAKRNFLAAWAALNAPVLVIFNEYDQFEAQYGADIIVETVNHLRPGTATLVVQQGLDHSSDRYQSAVAAYNGEGGVRAWRKTADTILNWLQQLTR